VLARLLTRRFGAPMPAWVEEKLHQGSEEELLAWSERLLFAATIEEEFAAGDR